MAEALRGQRGIAIGNQNDLFQGEPTAAAVAFAYAALRTGKSSQLSSLVPPAYEARHGLERVLENGRNAVLLVDAGHRPVLQRA